MNRRIHAGDTAGALPAIEAEKLTFRYDGQAEPVFRGLSFSVQQGSTALFLGPSGCGKSTLMYCLNRLYPDAVDGTLEGTVKVNGRDIAGLSPGQACREVGIVFQDPDSQFCMTRVDEEVAFGLENLGVPRSMMDERIHRTLEQAGLLDVRNERIHTLSGGMKQKLAAACALAADPRILILDEPTAQLDPWSARMLARWLGQLQRERELTLLLVEHRLDEWIEGVDQCIVLDAEGRRTGEGTPRACFTAHGERFASLGIWMPTVTGLAREIGKSGALRRGELPITEGQFLEAVARPAEVLSQLEERLHTPLPPDRTVHASASLSVRGLTVRIGSRTVLRRIDLDCRPGELTAIIGKNGSGKTTLLQHLAGIGGKPSAGAALLNGRPIADTPQPEWRRHIGYVFQNPEHQFVTLTVFDEAAFGMRLQRLPEELIREKVHRLLMEIGLDGYEDANPFSLSQGQKRRLSAATMLADEQSWLLLDEPTFGQDARTSEQIMRLLRQRIHCGASVVMVSHDMGLVQQYADRVVLVIDGEIRYDGTPSELWEQHRLLEEGGILPPVLARLRARLIRQCAGRDIDASLGAVTPGG